MYLHKDAHAARIEGSLNDMPPEDPTYELPPPPDLAARISGAKGVHQSVRWLTQHADQFPQYSSVDECTWSMRASCAFRRASI